MAEPAVPAERTDQETIQWLRQRGVEVDLAEDRDAYLVRPCTRRRVCSLTDPLLCAQADPNPDKGYGQFSYLKLPADESLPPTLLTAFRPLPPCSPCILTSSPPQG